MTPESATAGQFARADAIRAFRMREETTRTLTTSTGGEFRFGDNTLTVESTWSRANKRDPQRDRWNFASSGISGRWQLDPRGYNISFADDAAFTPSAFLLESWQPEHRRATEDLWQARADYLMPFGSNGSDVQFGLKYIQRDKTNSENEEMWGYAGGPLSMADITTGWLDPVMGRYRMGPRVNGPRVDAYRLAHPGEFARDEAATLGASLGGDYAIREDIAAAYLMTRLWLGDVTVIPGVRVEKTRGRYAAHAFDRTTARIDQPFNRFGARSYTDVFPGINLRWDAGEALVVRGAVTRAIGRPDYANLAPFIDVRDGSSLSPRVTMGNPDLAPLYSSNVDLSLEYYLGNRGIVSAAVFYKDISDPIYAVTGGIALTGARVRSWVNAHKARVSGLELNAQYELGFLPAPLDGLSVGVNASFVDSKADGLPARTDKVPLLDQSDRVVSALLSYEKAGFSAQLAYSYRSAMLNQVHETDPEGDIYWDSLKQWDLKFGYAITPRWSLFVEGANLNNAPMRAYSGRRERTMEVETYGWSARMGVQFKF